MNVWERVYVSSDEELGVPVPKQSTEIFRLTIADGMELIARRIYLPHGRSVRFYLNRDPIAAEIALALVTMRVAKDQANPHQAPGTARLDAR